MDTANLFILYGNGVYKMRDIGCIGTMILLTTEEVNNVKRGHIIHLFSYL